MAASSSSQIRVFIAENNARLLAGLVTTLTIQSDFELVGTAISGEEAVEQCQILAPDVILLTMGLPDLDAITVIKVIHQKQPETKIIVLPSFAEEALVKKAEEVGAVGYIQIGDSAETLAATIRDVMSSEVNVDNLDSQEVDLTSSS